MLRGKWFSCSTVESFFSKDKLGSIFLRNLCNEVLEISLFNLSFKSKISSAVLYFLKYLTSIKYILLVM